MISPSTQLKRPVFSVLIHEKGGSERREIFEATELGVGRVQGNELMLPKGNVSKRHAKLLYRDGRFIVTDLNSTNGTYVNRRRISQATIVRDGDRIHIGDFVLRIEMPPALEPDTSTPNSLPEVPSPSTTGQESSEPSISLSGVGADESGPHAGAPSPGRIASEERLASELESDSGWGSGPAGDPSSPEIDPDISGTLEESGRPERSVVYSTVSELVLRISSQVGPEELVGSSDAARAVATALSEQLGLLQKERALPDDILEAAGRAARAELLELGPVGPLLEDPDVVEVSVPCFDSVYAVRTGGRRQVELGFSSRESLERVLFRLCAATGEPLRPEESVVERRFADGGRLSSVRGAALLTGPMLSVKKVRRSTGTLEGLVREGVVSRAMATFLQQCSLAGANMLVVGSRDASTGSLVAALVKAAPGHRPIALLDHDDPVSEVDVAVRVSAPPAESDAARLVEAAAGVFDGRLTLDLSSPERVSAVVEAAGRGASGIVASVRARGIRFALERLSAELASVRGLTPAVAREWVAACFDLVVEVARLSDGRQRVVRVSEPSVVDSDELNVVDVFRFVIDRVAAGGAIEGTFASSGQLPRVLDLVRARGLRLESSLFGRTSGAR